MSCVKRMPLNHNDFFDTVKERKKGIRKANRSCKKSTKQSLPLFLCLRESSHENGQSQRVESGVEFLFFVRSSNPERQWCWRLNISRISLNHVFIAGFWEVEACQKQMRTSYFWSKCIPLEYYFLVSNLVFLGPFDEHSVLWEAMNTKQLFRNWLHCGDEGGDRYEETLKGHLCPNQGKMHLFPLCRNR